jgi:hypothetical protein
MILNFGFCCFFVLNYSKLAVEIQLISFSCFLFLIQAEYEEIQDIVIWPDQINC